MIEIPLWLLILILLFAAVTALSHLLLPSVRWFFRRRLERAVKKLNQRLTRPIEPFKLAHRHDMIQRLIYDPEVNREIIEHAKENEVPENVAFEIARGYAREIVPSFSAFAYFGFGIRAARLLGETLFDVRTDPRNEARLQNLDPKATVIFIMNHRSNMDYVLVTYLAARASALSYAVGEWARVWPLSRLIKSMGAYFIRRKSRGRLYRKVLARYVQMATQGGVTQAVFPEGGLSLDGKLMPPKIGLLSYIINGTDPETNQNVVFVPVAINYDRVLEDRVLITANERGERKFGGKASVIFKFIFRRIWQKIKGQPFYFGRASVTFGTPVPLSQYQNTTDAESIASDLMARIEEVMPVLMVPLLSRILLTQNLPAQGDKMKAVIEESIGPNMRKTLAFDAEECEKLATFSLHEMAKRKLITLDSEQAHWHMCPQAENILMFYANSLAHFDPLMDASAE